MAILRVNQLSDEAIENLENQIPEMAAAATRLAYFRAVAAGHTVVTVDNNHIIATHADGHVEVLAETKPSLKVKTGQRFTVRKLSGRT
ncbi:MULTISPECIES: hypothetical protein [Pseudomonas]|uniref:Uncharacterized protein n=1 Tax=Pseudomonas taiwanensis TaxID=470150 RepID=A0A7L9GG50_9PSED|nr:MULTISPECIES: hypothetical protein [Pseudomonas]MDH4552563.1 hypothetical protein [Pseudomonas sp. BN607]QOJ91393.1 hypothetical protein ICN73_00525 [Pseudomonas taiwanensis]WQQ38189.1 hypothetical protein SO572_05930 [Pseudomonas putida]